MMHTSSLSVRLNAYGYLIQNLTMERIYHFLALPLCGTAHVKFIALWLNLNQLMVIQITDSD